MSSSGAAGARPRVAVLGAGTMGRGMAHSLLRAGFTVDVWNRTPEPAAQLAADGATAHEDPRDAVRHADVVITMVADAAAVNQVAFDLGMLEALRPEAAWSQMSTIGVSASEELGARVSKERPDVYFADAPVSGTRGPAENGQLLILASGPDAAKPVLEPVYAALGRETKWLGPAGAGSRLKLVMNSWLVILVEGTAEMMALADSLGVDHQQVADFLSAGNLANPAAAAKFAKMDARDDTADFSLQWALKDIRLATDDSGRRLPALDTVRDRWAALVDTTTNHVTDTIAVGSYPDGVAVNPHGTRAYVTNGSFPGSVSVINTATNHVTATIGVGNEPDGVAVAPRGTRAYVTNIGSRSVSVINTATNHVTATIGGFRGPAGVAVSPDGTRAYVTGVSPGSVTVIDTGTCHRHHPRPR